MDLLDGGDAEPPLGSDSWHGQRDMHPFWPMDHLGDIGATVLNADRLRNEWEERINRWSEPLIFGSKQSNQSMWLIRERLREVAEDLDRTRG